MSKERGRAAFVVLCAVVTLGSGCASSGRFYWEPKAPLASAQSIRTAKMPVRFDITKVKEQTYRYCNNRSMRGLRGGGAVSDGRLQAVRRHAERRYPSLFGGSAVCVPIDVSVYAGNECNDVVTFLESINIFPLAGVPSIILPMPQAGIRAYPEVKVTVVIPGVAGQGGKAGAQELGSLPYLSTQKEWYTGWFSPIGMLPVPGKAKVRWSGYGGGFGSYLKEDKLTAKVWASDEWLDFVVDSVATVLMKREPGYYKHLYYTKIKPEAAFVP